MNANPAADIVLVDRGFVDGPASRVRADSADLVKRVNAFFLSAIPEWPVLPDATIASRGDIACR